MKKIAVIVKTTGLEYDDRVRKVSKALSNKFEVRIFVLLDNNLKSKGVTSYGIEFESVKLTSRKILPNAKFLSIKVIEFYLKLRNKLKSYDYIWANEEDTFIFPLLAKKNTFIWDLHEIHSFFLSGYKRYIYQYIERKSLKIVHANPERINYLINNSLIQLPEKHAYVHNYPDRVFVNSQEKAPFYNKFVSWLADEEYIYIQGINGEDRFPYNTLSSIMDKTNYKIIVVGKIEPNSLKLLQNNYKEILNTRVYFAGMVDQLSIPTLLKNARYTIVLYEITKPNNRYCEANRLYQAISLGVPVIVGINDTMANLVKNKFGIVLNSDGNDINELYKAISQLKENYREYKSNCVSNSKNYIWKDEFVDFDWFK